MFKFIHARTTSDIFDPSTTLGIEITVPEIAALCGLGNLDGQHGHGFYPRALGRVTPGWMYGSATRLAMDYRPSDAYLDAREAGSTITMATSRPDLDAVASMAIYVIDALQLSWTIDHRLVHVIDSADSFRAEKWEPRPLPTEEHPWPCGPSTVDATRETAHLGMICSPRRGDFGDVRRLGHRVWNESTGPAFRVYVIACALCGMESKAWPDEHGPFKDDADLYAAIARACGLDVSWIAAWDTIAQAKQGVLESRQALAQAAHVPGSIVERGKFVVVRVAHAGALSLGYCLAPVVVAFDQQNAGKVTICAYTDGHLDARGVTAELNRLEAKAGGTPQWGGPRNMCSSPQVAGGTLLSEQTIADVVARFML